MGAPGRERGAAPPRRREAGAAPPALPVQRSRLALKARTWVGCAERMAKISYKWKPIEAPADVAALSIKELRPLIDLWARERRRLQESSALATFTERIARRWSIETGVVERVYDVSMGVTMTLVEQGFDATLIAHGEATLPPELLVDILRDHRAALHMVMDVIGGAHELSTGWIKELHALITRHQDTAKGLTLEGSYIDIPLQKGMFKTRPNNPTREDGSVHKYCPPEHVASEMDRLIEIYRTLPPELPEVRAAWLHHAFTQIHPFQDGNGRVARALASIDFIRAGLFPLLVDRTEFGRKYVPALELADHGDLQPLVSYFAECQRRMLLKAISEAETAMGPANTLAAVLQAAKQKVGHQRPLAAQDRGTMVERIAPLAAEVEAHLKRTCERVQAEVPGIKASVRTADPTRAHWYRSQIITFANEHGYWADLREPRTWVRLDLRDGGRTEVVVSLHFVGNPSPGVLAAAIFLVHRERKSKDLQPANEVDNAPVTLLGVEPLSFAPGELLEEQRLRLSKWLDTALVAALSQWTRYL
jgi:hypothetical protein